jgi:hypothetical protein
VKTFIQFLIIVPLIQIKLHFHFAQKADPGSPGQKSRVTPQDATTLAT